MSGPISTAVRHSSVSATTPAPPRPHSPSSSTYSDPKAPLSPAPPSYGGKPRKAFAILTSLLFLVTVILLILVQIGNTSNKLVLRDLYFFKADFSQLKPTAMAQARGGRKVGKSVAQELGIRDFYQVGMWNFCEGGKEQGITACSRAQMLYWFNPVQILLDEVLQGQTVNLPDMVVLYLTTIRIASKALFICFFVSTFSSFLSIFFCPLATYSRLVSIPIALFTFLSALMTLLGAIIATSIWCVLRREIIRYQADVYIVPSIGIKMFVLMWVAAGCAMFAAIGQMGMLCCGTGRRHVRKRIPKVGRKERTETKATGEENPALRRRWWGSVSQ